MEKLHDSIAVFVQERFAQLDVLKNGNEKIQEKYVNEEHMEGEKDVCCYCFCALID